MPAGGPWQRADRAGERTMPASGPRRRADHAGERTAPASGPRRRAEAALGAARPPADAPAAAGLDYGDPSAGADPDSRP
ncbi:hypothetical protein D7I43_07675 [Micromonospora globbae]|uniref:Uncharacterized protein n=1 Tax=Micromonospora globbae TaxID=1894969 RepID=A0A420F5J6_9ACTN|nr:hypothetical protein D7I43_07675 [Micromonospora globbae]